MSYHNFLINPLLDWFMRYERGPKYFDFLCFANKITPYVANMLIKIDLSILESR